MIIIDRFENGFAVCEIDGEKTENLPRCFLPAGAREGDVLTILVDEGETRARKKRIEEKLKKLWS